MPTKISNITPRSRNALKIPTCAVPRLPPPAAAKPIGAAGEETDQAFDIDIVLKRDMVVHEGGEPREPGRGAADLAVPPVMNANEAPRGDRMHLAGEGFEFRQRSGGGASPRHRNTTMSAWRMALRAHFEASRPPK